MALPRPRAWRRPLLLLAEAMLAGSLAGHAPRAAAAEAGAAVGAEAVGDAAAPRLVAGDVTLDPGGEPLVLAVTLNGEDRGLVRVRLAEGALWAAPAELRAIGLQVTGPGTAPQPLAGLPGLAIDFRPEQQALNLTAPVELLGGERRSINVTGGEAVTSSGDAGAVLNYDLYASHGGATAISGLFELRGFAGNRLAETTALVQWSSHGPDRVPGVVRLDSALTLAWPGRRMALRLGDSVTGSTAWSRPIRLGGVQLGTDFSLQPYLDTAPLTLLTGSAALPSRAELYVDGVRRFAGELPAGPFAIGAGPARIDGAGRAELVTTDLLGRVSVQSFTIYETPRLLRPGLSDWSVEFGAVRREHGLRSFGYARAGAFSATLRHGLTPWLTMEGHAEAAPGLVQAGLGGVLLAGRAGVVTASLAASRTDAGGAGTGGGTGISYALGYSYARRGFNLALHRQRATARFADLAALDGTGPPQINDFAQVGWSSPALGAVGATLLRLHHARRPEQAYAGLTWSRSLHRGLTVRLSANQNLADRRDRSLAFSVGITPGHGWHASAAVQNQSGRTSFDLSAEHPVSAVGGLGWRGRVGHFAGHASAAGLLTWLGDAGELQVGASHLAGRNAGYLGFSGSVATLGGRLHAGRKVDDSFAVVTVGGVPDLPVLLESNVIGRTDRNGELLVRGLHANQVNRLAIGLDELPQEVLLVKDTLVAVPARGAGLRIAFPLRALRALSLVAVDRAARPLAAGTPVRRDLGGAGSEGAGEGDLAVGFDGQLYIEDPRPGERLFAGDGEGACTLQLPVDLPAGIAALPAPLVCEAAP